MLVIATFGAAALLLFHAPTKYGSDRFRQIFIDHWEKWWNYLRDAGRGRRILGKALRAIGGERFGKSFYGW
jgi:hypothetical protein